MGSTIIYSKNDNMAKRMEWCDERSKKLRRKIIETIAISKRGHLPSALSIVEILRVLYDYILKVDPKNPKQKKRDRFILSKGHGCLALYVMLADKGEKCGRENCKHTSLQMLYSHFMHLNHFQNYTRIFTNSHQLKILETSSLIVL